MNDHHDLTLLADYHQIHIVDVGHRTGSGPVWTGDTVETMLSVGPNIVAFGTARNMDSPVRIELHDSRPTLDVDPWDQVAECFIVVPSHRILIKGCAEYEPTAFTMDVPSSNMSVRIMWGGLELISADGLDGDDHYVVQLWPDDPHGAWYPKKRTIRSADA